MRCCRRMSINLCATSIAAGLLFILSAFIHPQDFYSSSGFLAILRTFIHPQYFYSSSGLLFILRTFIHLHDFYSSLSNGGEMNKSPESFVIVIFRLFKSILFFVNIISLYFSISDKILPHYVYYYSILIRM